jgi:glycosyltransferase involved in cell wall biosynthesis
MPDDLRLDSAPSRARAERCMRIVLTTNFSPWSRYCGGGQRSTHALASALSARGHDVTAVYTKPPWERVALPPDLLYRVVWATMLASSSRRDASLRPWSALSVAACVRRLAGERKLDIVHGQGEEAALVPRVVRSAFVMTPRYPSFPASLRGDLSFGERARFALSGPKYLALGCALRSAHWVCPTSQQSAAAVVRAFGLPPERIAVVPNGVDASFFAATRRADIAAPTLLFFGRIEREKGVDVLIEAFASLTSDAKLLLVGEGKDLPALLRRAAELAVSQRVQHISWRSAAELVQLLERTSLVVLPSREESFGNAMIETLAAGAPLLSTSAGSIPEVVRAGKDAFLVPPSDPEALAAAMRMLLADRSRCEQMGRAGRAHVRARFSWASTARVYEQLYERALASEEAFAQRRRDRAGAQPAAAGRGSSV